MPLALRDKAISSLRSEKQQQDTLGEDKRFFNLLPKREMVLRAISEGCYLQHGAVTEKILSSATHTTAHF